MKTIRHYLLLAALATLAACGGDDNTGPDGNDGGSNSATFQMTLDGDIDHSMTGPVAFAGQPADPETETPALFAIGGGTAQEDTPNSGAFAFFRENEARPGTGEYEIGSVDDENGDIFYAIIFTGTDETLRAWGSESGTLKITKSTSDRLEGSFTFTATGGLITGPGDETVTITGTFKAVHGSNVDLTVTSIKQYESLKVSK